MVWFSLTVLGLASFGLAGFVGGYAAPRRHYRLPLKKEAPEIESLLFPVVFGVPVFLWMAFSTSLSAAFLIGGGLLLGGLALGWYYYHVNRTKVMGITGTIGSGKSLVGKLLEEEGIPVIDTDHVVHRLLASDAQVHLALRARFGDEIFLPDGGIDRKKLRFIFKDEKAKKDLEAVLHPRVRAEVRRLVAEMHGKHRWVAVLVPLLFEANLEGDYDFIVTVIARDEVVRVRLKKRDNLTDEEVDVRLAAQFPQDEKARRSHRVLDNSDTVDDTRFQVKQLLGELSY